MDLSGMLCGAPPTVDNAFLIGRKRSHYDIHSVARYQCADGFLQRHVPTAKCRANGKWDRPKIICIKSPPPSPPSPRAFIPSSPPLSLLIIASQKISVVADFRESPGIRQEGEGLL
ncbi:Neurocan core protein [Liparis tanakae]|uniref:Neurocan core protein n=1 Tax=Liparis tanakae TaxID=230148 RepID=A0A4Z2EKF6_9TELE|nr:Neurocan core protein [Liparis tanakae]